MRVELPTNLPRLGERPYVQGGTIFNGMLAAFDSVLFGGWLTDRTIRSFKLQRQANSNGRFVISDETSGGDEANTVMVVEGAGPRHYCSFFETGVEAPHIPYDEESYYQAVRVGEELSGEFFFPAGRQREDFMRGVVGANKLLHQRTTLFGCTLKEIQFLYLKDLPGTCIARSGEALRLTIDNVRKQDEPAEIWTINRIAVHGESFEAQFRICYRAAKG